jgi:hypothetical protein
MSNTDSGSIELSRPEARTIISALSEFQTAAGGSGGERALNVREHVKEEFGFEEEETPSALFERFGEGFFDDTSSETVKLSDREAETVVSALSSFENEAPDENRETLRDVRRRFENEFGVSSEGM